MNLRLHEVVCQIDRRQRDGQPESARSADEAHGSQHDFVDGFAAHMRHALPPASFIGFTGTPIELQEANTRAVSAIQTDVGFMLVTLAQIEGAAAMLVITYTTEMN